MILNKKHRAKVKYYKNTIKLLTEQTDLYLKEMDELIEKNECYSFSHGRLTKFELERTRYLYEKIVDLLFRTKLITIFSLTKGVKEDFLNVMIEKHRELEKEKENLKNILKALNSEIDKLKDMDE